MESDRLTNMHVIEKSPTFKSIKILLNLEPGLWMLTIYSHCFVPSTNFMSISSPTLFMKMLKITGPRTILRITTACFSPVDIDPLRTRIWLYLFSQLQVQAVLGWSILHHSNLSRRILLNLLEMPSYCKVCIPLITMSRRKVRENFIQLTFMTLTYVQHLTLWLLMTLR